MESVNCALCSCGRYLRMWISILCLPLSVMQRICVLIGLRRRLLACSIMTKIAVVCRRVSMRFWVAMQRSSQYPRIMPLCGEMVVEIKRIIGSRARAKRVMERGQPCLTPEWEMK